MSQIVVAGANVSGRFTFISRVSVAAEQAGISREDVIGKYFWEYDPEPSARKIRDAFSNCLIDGIEQHYTAISQINGRTEYWDTVLYRASEPTYVIAVCSEALTGEVPQVTGTEMRIITSLCDDRHPSEIATELGITDSSVSGHLRRLREKFRVRTNHGLVAAAIRFRIVRDAI